MPKKDIALITGGGTGIGLSIAKKLHSMNKTVVLTGRRKEKLLGPWIEDRRKEKDTRTQANKFSVLRLTATHEIRNLIFFF